MAEFRAHGSFLNGLLAGTLAHFEKLYLTERNQAMTTNISRGSMGKKKSATVSRQLNLIDEQGCVPFNPQTDAIPVDAEAGKYRIGEMKIHLSPVPKNTASAITLVVDNLRLLEREEKQLSGLGEAGLQVISLESWTCSRLSVTVRKTTEKGVIRATYIGRENHLEISLPPRKSWAECGLAWLLRGRACCSREVNNPTPWLGKQCGCK